MDAPISSADSGASFGSGPAVDLVAQHRRIRTRLRWLLPVGGVLLLLLAYQLATYPERAPLSGYRYQQVGVQPDSTWWLLAYREGKAEILFSRDTAQGWQRRELGIDSAQARSLALNWGGKAIIVGDGGAVRVYDSLFRPLDSVRYPLGNAFRARWVAADKSGQRAVALGDGGQAMYSADGGNVWQSRVTPTGVILKKRSAPAYWRERAAFGTSDELDLANRSDYVRISTGPPLTYAGGGQWVAIPSIPLAKAGAGLWASPTDSVPIIYFSLSPGGLPQLLRQDGSAKTMGRHYTSAQISDQFPADAKPIDAAFSPTRPGFCLLISRTRVFAGRLGGPFAAVQPAIVPDTTAADKPPTASTKTKPIPAAKGTSKSKLTSAIKASKATTQKKKIPSQPATSSTVRNTEPPLPTRQKPDTTGAAARARNRAAAESKSGSKNPYQQTAPANSSPVQQTAPANDEKRPSNSKESKENPPRKLESAQ